VPVYKGTLKSNMTLNDNYPYGVTVITTLENNLIRSQTLYKGQVILSQ